MTNTAGQNPLSRVERRSPTVQIDNRPSDIRLDQYYTHPDVARRLYAVLLSHTCLTGYLMIEPSAGTGSFFMLLSPGSLGFDVEPKYPGIMTADFLEAEIDSGGQKMCFIGNPPFGRQSRKALRFVNHAARQGAEIVAMILPRTFRKRNLQNEINSYLHLIHEEIVPRKAFLFRGKPYDVPAVFQIWQRRDKPRVRWLLETEHPDFEFTESAPDTFGLQRVGARAGTVHDDLGMSPKSHYFIRPANAGVRRIFERLQPQFRRAASNVAGVPSLAKSEIIALYRKRTGT